ncbi:MAG: hypothetical protein KDD10_24585, partial [Phaeodactylibacter sp.]|nr:hypothetical protein [Phaeodactylibacter sp.]
VQQPDPAGTLTGCFTSLQLRAVKLFFKDYLNRFVPALHQSGLPDVIVSKMIVTPVNAVTGKYYLPVAPNREGGIVQFELRPFVL